MDRLLTSPSGPPRRMAELDLLRCLAILMVVTLHAAAPLLSDPSLLGTPAWYFCLLLDPFSRTGVPIFFMLSGFLLLRDPRTLQVGPFYRRRLPRLAVPLVLWNLIYALADAWSARRPFWSIWRACWTGAVITTSGSSICWWGSICSPPS